MCAGNGRDDRCILPVRNQCEGLSRYHTRSFGFYRRPSICMSLRRMPLCDDERNSCLTCVMATNTRRRTHTCDFVGGLTLTSALTSLGATCMRPNNRVCPIKVYVLQCVPRVAPDTCNSSWQAKLLVGSWRPSPTANGRTPRESSNAF